jgi:hypothetical protein
LLFHGANREGVSGSAEPVLFSWIFRFMFGMFLAGRARDIADKEKGAGYEAAPGYSLLF